MREGEDGAYETVEGVYEPIEKIITCIILESIQLPLNET